MPLQPFPIAITMAALQYGVVTAPILAYGIIRKSKGICFAAAFTFRIGVIDSGILFIPSFGLMGPLKYNWLQKALALVCVVLIARSPALRKVDSALGPSKSGWALPAGLLVGFLLASFDAVTSSDPSQSCHFNWFDEAFCFELTMPGLQEEPLYRGLMLSVLDEHLGCPWKALGVQFGMGSIITSIGFAVVHLVQIDNHWRLMVTPNVVTWLNFFVFSLSLCWLRYKFKSVWPCVLAHNMDNTLSPMISQLLVHE
jgi:hypothetical protein